MNAKELTALGIPIGEPVKFAVKALAAAAKSGVSKDEMRKKLESLVDDPENFQEDPIFAELAEAMMAHEPVPAFEDRGEPAPYKSWGEGLDAGSVSQMEQACRLPVAVAGALMPDAHQGYGLPIGGVLATTDTVIPYAVGVDIACRMKLSVLDLPTSALSEQQERLRKAIQTETRFGVGASFSRPRENEIMDEDWAVTEVTAGVKDKAWKQLGTSGSGNHFVEFGLLTFEQGDLGLEDGTYLALLSHSGSRGAGSTVANHYSKVAREKRPELPAELSRLAWLELDSAEGQEYWQAMELMGRYAAANHMLIHHHIARHLGVEVMLDVENHHNFAWKERYRGRDVVVHRKGATPAGPEALGIIPGSMGTAGYLVRGKGRPESLHSASHGAGRKMSRKAAKKAFSWNEARAFLEERGVVLISAGLDEVPMAYKDIEEVMEAQQDLVEPVAKFEPRLVKMAPPDERPED